MAIVHMQEYEIGDRSTENYDFMKEKLGDIQIEGLIVHTAGFDDDSGVWRMLDVWESREHADKFMVRVMADGGRSGGPPTSGYVRSSYEGGVLRTARSQEGLTRVSLLASRR